MLRLLAILGLIIAIAQWPLHLPKTLPQRKEIKNFQKEKEKRREKKKENYNLTHCPVISFFFLLLPPPLAFKPNSMLTLLAGRRKIREKLSRS